MGISLNVLTIPRAKPIGHGNARAVRHPEIMTQERKQDQTLHPLDVSTASIIQGCRRIRSTIVQLTADKIQLTGSNRKDPTLIKHHSKLLSATCSTSNRTSTDLATTRRKKMESANREDLSEAIQMTSIWTAKTQRKRHEERNEEERND
jgi:hypothetical protein